MPTRIRFFLPFVLILLSFSSRGILFGVFTHAPEHKLRLEDCLLPHAHPLQEQLKDLFIDSRMFKSPDHLSQEGFQVNPRMHLGLMVAGHPSLSNYLFKKFKSSVSQKNQLKNFLRRVNGARALRSFIESNNLQHIIVPQKWIYRLPAQFSDSKSGEAAYILIVEKIDICSGGKDPKGEVARRYYTIDKEILREICVVLYHFRGLDSVLHNVPFTYQNKIAFIDTEKWEESRDEFLPRIKPFLSSENRDYVNEVIQELRNES